MNEPISIQIDYDHKDYTPGQTIAGTVSWTAESTTKRKKNVSICLFYKTSGRGTEEVHTVAETSWPKEQLQGSFEFTLPHQPYSFSGKLISLSWGLEAISSSQKETVIYDINLIPNGQAILLDALEEDNSGKGFFQKFKPNR